MKTSKIPAITIIEIAVAMAITAIVVAIAFNSLGILQRSFHSFSDRSEKSERVLLLIKLLKNDVRNSDIVRAGVNGIACEKGTGEVEYVWYSDRVLRKSGIAVDSFMVNVGQPVISFENQPAVAGKPVDNINFNWLHGQETFTVAISKHYAAEKYLNVFNKELL